MPQDDDLDTMEGIVDTVAKAGDGDRVAVSDVVEEIGDDAFGPLMLVPALVAVTPASGIPGLTATAGLMIVLVSAQLVMRRKALWLPAFLMDRSISRDKLATARDWLRKPARLLDKITSKRLSFLVRPPFDIFAATICMMCGMIMPFLEFIPFSGSFAAGAVALIALSFITEDGLLGVLASGLIGGLAYLIFGWVT